MQNISKHLQVNTQTTKTLHHLHYYTRISDNSGFQNDLNFFSSPLEYDIDLSTSSRKREILEICALTFVEKHVFWPEV